MPRQNRASAEDIATIRGARAVRTRHFLVTARRSDDGTTKIACSVAKKIARQAVDRNRLKRHCRAAARASLSSLAHPSTVLIRILSKDASWDDFLAELPEAFAKAS